MRTQLAKMFSVALLLIAAGCAHTSLTVDDAKLANNVGLQLFSQGKYAQAEPYYKLSLAIKEEALGPDHPSVAVSLNNLAELYCVQGQYAQAESLYKSSLAIREKALGPDHPIVAMVLENMAELCRKTGREEEAQKLDGRVASIRKIEGRNKGRGPSPPSIRGIRSD